MQARRVRQRKPISKPVTTASNHDQTARFTPISLLFVFCGAPNQSVSIDLLDMLPLYQQLDILNVRKIRDDKSRSTLIRNLCDQLPALSKSATNQHHFKSILSEFQQQHSALNHLFFSPTEWTQSQISLSLFCYVLDRLRRKPTNDEDKKEYSKEMESADAIWQFIHFLRKYCAEKRWNGKKMKKYWDEITENGQKTDLFAQKFQYLIINRFELKTEKHARRRVRRTVHFWYLKALKVDSRGNTKSPSDPLSINGLSL